MNDIYEVFADAYKTDSKSGKKGKDSFSQFNDLETPAINKKAGGKSKVSEKLDSMKTTLFNYNE